MHLPDLRRWGVTGIIGRLQSREIAKKALGAGAPVIAMDLSHEQLAAGGPISKVSEIRPDSEEAGYRAAELLDALMFRRRRKPQLIQVEPLWVVARQSTDVVAVEDQEVAAALRYIRENARAPIGVDDVVEQLALSRRALEIRFKQSLGRSMKLAALSMTRRTGVCLLPITS